MFSGIKKEFEEYVMNEEDVCPKCGGSLQVIGKQVVRTEIVLSNLIKYIEKCCPILDTLMGCAPIISYHYA